MEHYAITIARGFGSGGREIASKLADELGIHSYENRILTLAARYSGRDDTAPNIINIIPVADTGRIRRIMT